MDKFFSPSKECKCNAIWRYRRIAEASGGGDEVGVGVIGATKERREGEVEMTIPFAEHNASHFETTIEARKSHFVGKRGTGPRPDQVSAHKKTQNPSLNMLLEIRP